MGEATIGGASRHVTLRLACDPAQAGLSAALTIPRFADVSATFDFDAFEGPGGTGQAPHRDPGRGGERRAQHDRPGERRGGRRSGHQLHPDRRRPEAHRKPLRGIAPGLAEANARIVWTQSSPRAGDAAIIATFPVTDAAAMRKVIEPCVPGAPS